MLESNMNKFASLIFALAVVACGTEPIQSNLTENETQKITVDEGIFKLYGTTEVIPNKLCDLHVLLTLKNTVSGSIAILENALEGLCEIAVVPNQLTYVLNEVPDTCGSRVFEGKLAGATKDIAPSIVIIDHRNRICKDLVPASIIVEQRYSDNTVETLYSLKNKALTMTSLEGSLTRMMAIGGESTGYALQLADGSLVEIELAGEFIREFVEGQAVKLAGNYKTVRGIAIPVRQIFVVKSMSAL